MDADRLEGGERSRISRIADYQFGAGAGDVLFPPNETLWVERTSSGRPEQVHADDGRLVTQTTDGRFTVSPLAGRRLADAFDPPRNRVIVGDESGPYVREGRNAFAKFVREVDPSIRPGDDVLVTHDGDLLGVGRAELSGTAMLDFETGMAVKIRHGVPE